MDGLPLHALTADELKQHLAPVRARAVLDVTVPYREDVARVRSVLSDVADDLWHDEDFEGVIIEEPEIWGVEAVTADQVTIRVTRACSSGRINRRLVPGAATRSSSVIGPDSASSGAATSVNRTCWTMCTEKSVVS